MDQNKSKLQSVQEMISEVKNEIKATSTSINGMRKEVSATRLEALALLKFV